MASKGKGARVYVLARNFGLGWCQEQDIDPEKKLPGVVQRKYKTYCIVKMDIDGELEEVNIEDVMLYEVDRQGYSGFRSKRPRVSKNPQHSGSSNDEDGFSSDGSQSNQNYENGDEGRDNPIADHIEEVLERQELSSSSSESEHDNSEYEGEEWSYLEKDEEFEFGETDFGAHKPKLNLPNLHTKSIFRFFEHFMPVEFVETVILPCTNDYAEEMNSNWKPVNKGEFYRWLGLWCLMLVHRHPGRRMYWSKPDSDVPVSYDFGKYMSRNRFEDILAYLRLDDFDEDLASQAGNELCSVEKFIDACCKRWMAAVVVGKYLVCDESIIKGFSSYLYAKKKFKRKPRPIGVEFKDVCCGECLIVVNIELVDKPDVQSAKELTPELGSTAATTVRLTKYWNDSNRCVIADSWFGNITTAVELKKRGLFSIMNIKQGSKGFPKKELKEKYNHNGRGGTSIAGSECEGIHLIASSWKDKTHKQFLSTCGVPGYSDKGRITRNGTEIKRPKIASEYFEYAAGIDVKNHTRLGGKNG
eukprot:Pgem_evm1s19311